MKITWIIAWRDFKSNFASPIAYIVIAAFVFVLGWMFFWNLDNFIQQSSAHGMNQARSPSIADGIVRPLYGNMNVIFLFTIPFITMRLFAEERKNQTMALLMTAPITTLQMVMGKFLSAVLFIAIILGATFLYPAVLFLTGNPDPGPIIASIIGTFLMAASVASMGLFFSSTTENQIVAAALTFFSALFFWLVPWASQAATGPIGDILNYIGIINHFNNFSRGVFHLTDFVFYFSFCGFFLYLSYRILDSLRWR